MDLLLSAIQRERLNRGKELFFSPEAKALRSDPVLGGSNQELAALDYFLSGYKNLEPRYGEEDEVVKSKSGEIIRKGKNELPGLALAVDDEVNIDELERLNHQIDETKRFITNGEVPNSFSSLEPEDIAYLREAVIKHIYGGAIDSVGELGTKNRKYPLTYADTSLRGKVIPAVFMPGQKRERGVNLLTDVMQNIDKDTGVGTYGNSINALHREAAANNPTLLTDINNIRMGNSSLNQSVKDFEGEDLNNSLQTRLLRLNDEKFALENGVRPAPADTGSVTKKENLSSQKLYNAIDEELLSLKNGIEILDAII